VAGMISTNKPYGYSLGYTY